MKEALTPDSNGEVKLNYNYVLIGAWTSYQIPTNITVNGGAITIDGDGHTISGLTAALLCDNFCTDLAIKNLTIKDSTIASGNNASGAIIAYMNQLAGLTIDNCHLVNSTVNCANALQAGGLVGLVTNMPMTISGCSVKNSTINGGSSAAGIVGLATTQQTVTMTIENCSVTGSTITSVDDGDWRVGAIVGTVNGDGTLTISSCTETNNTYKMDNSNFVQSEQKLYGRAVNATVNVN